MIPFNKPYFSGRELKYLEEVCHSTTMSGNGDFTKKCHTFFEQKYGFKKCLLATSGTDALEMCAMLCNLKPGDEVIVPSYTFVSTALAFLREGAKVVFADSSAENPNMEVEQIEPLINEKTKVSSVSVTNAGDMQLKAQIDAAADDKCEGALFTLYEAGENGEKTALPDYSVSATKNESKEIFAVLGGSSDNSTTDETGETTHDRNNLRSPDAPAGLCHKAFHYSQRHNHTS